MRRLLVGLLGVAIVSAAPVACAHRSVPAAAAPWELRGTVVAAGEERLQVRHKSGQIVELVLDARTTVVGQEGAATVSALTHGRRVVVHVEPLGDGRSRAAQVRVFGAG